MNRCIQTIYKVQWQVQCSVFVILFLTWVKNKGFDGNSSSLSFTRVEKRKAKKLINNYHSVQWKITNLSVIFVSPLTNSYVLSNAFWKSLKLPSVLTSNTRGRIARIIRCRPESLSDVAVSSNVLAKSIKVPTSFSSNQGKIESILRI